MCNPQSPATSPISRLMFAADALSQLSPDSNSDEIARQFAQFRELLWQLIEVAPDPAPYTHAWNLINLYAKVDLLELEQGNDGALIRLRHKVAESITLLP